MITNYLMIALTPDILDEGPDYERAAFGLLEISAAGQELTSVISANARGWDYAGGPYVSGYHLAEWLVWNWWRLRWEPRPTVDGLPPLDWDLSHRMSDIGAGYIWPNITISCDGLQCELTSERSEEFSNPFFYLGAPPVVIPAGDFENAADQFIAFILKRLHDYRIADSNLQTLWNDLTVERKDPELAKFRRAEAIQGFDPDQVGEA